MNKNKLDEMSTLCRNIKGQFLIIQEEEKNIVNYQKTMIKHIINSLSDALVFIDSLKYKIYEEQENENKIHEKLIWHCYLCNQNITGILHQCPNMVAYKENPGKQYCNYCHDQIYDNKPHSCNIVTTY